MPVDAIHRSASYYRRVLAEGLEVVFVEHPPFFGSRPHPYGDGGRDYEDNRLRFAFFSRATLEYFRSRGERPDVFHAHDWQTGLLPVYLKSFYWDDPALEHTPTVFTIHNLAYQGNFPRDTVDVLGLPWHLAAREALEFHGGVSYMKGGLLFSELLNTVSPTYAREIQGGEMGYGLDGRRCGTGPRTWSASSTASTTTSGTRRNDRHIARNYDADDLSGKAACKADLLRTVGLPEEPDLPVVGITSRLVHQKGFDIVVRAWYDLLQRPLRMVVLGTGEPDVEAGFADLAARAPDRFAVRFAYDGALAHKIEAGSDIFLMPSRFEPCGLTQMYSLRYGTVPVVRATGGLVGHRGARRSRRRDGHRLPLRLPRRHGADVGPRPGPGRRTGTRRPGRRSCAAAWPGTSPGSAPPASTWTSIGARGNGSDRGSAILSKMADNNVQTFTDANWEADVLKSRAAGAGGLLGRLVRAVQDPVPDGGRGGRAVPGPAAGRQDERRGERRRARTGTTSRPCPRS